MTEAKEVIAKRIAEIEIALQQSIANHQALLGHRDEAKFLLDTIFKAEADILNGSESKAE